MKDRTKETIRDGFGSLINNSAALRGAKNGPLWLTIIFFVLSLFLPVLPLFIANINTSGSSFLKSYSYGLERYVTSVALDLETREIKFGIDEKHLLSVSEAGNPIDYTAYENAAFASYTNEVTGQYEFMLYVSDKETNKDKTAFNKAITLNYYNEGTTTLNPEETKTGVYRPSYMILFKDSVHVVINKGVKTVTTSLGGDYKTLKATENYLTVLLDVKDKEGNAVAKSLTNDEYTDGVYKNYKKFLDKSYDTLKIKNTFATSGIYLGIFFGVSVLMGFLMWVLTRGKKNPNNYFSPWLTMKIEARLSLAPALITLVAGFFLTNYAPMIFIMTLGLRVMWISMKELRPIQQ